jgi:hypothetical protein
MDKIQNSFERFKEGVEVTLEDRINERNTLIDEIRILEWEKRLTEEQYSDYLEGKLKPFDALDLSDIMRERDFGYYFQEGEIVKIEWEMLTPVQQEFFIELKDMHAVVTKCWSDLHAFGRGSSYMHDLRFENGVCSPKEPFIYDLETFERIPTWAIISISEKEQKYYDKEFKNRKPNQKLWWYT